MIVQARERERQVVQLFIRGLTWLEIARQLGYGEESGARKAFARAAKRIPPGDVKLLRKLEGERITDMRRRIWSELAGRPDPADPTKTIRPEPEQVMEMLRTAVRVGRHSWVEQEYFLVRPRPESVVGQNGQGHAARGSVRGRKTREPQTIIVELSTNTARRLWRIEESAERN